MNFAKRINEEVKTCRCYGWLHLQQKEHLNKLANNKMLGNFKEVQSVIKIIIR